MSSLPLEIIILAKCLWLGLKKTLIFLRLHLSVFKLDVSDIEGSKHKHCNAHMFFSLPLFRALLCFEMVCTNEKQVSNTGSSNKPVVRANPPSQHPPFCLYSAFYVDVQPAWFFFSCRKKKNKADVVWKQRTCRVLQGVFLAMLVRSFIWSCSAWQPVNSHFF